MAYAFDWTQDYAQTTVATAPSPASSGTSLTVTAGQGSLFPDPAVVGPYNCVDCPAAAAPTLANAEEVRVTAKSGDVFTITRAQGLTSARTIVAGDRFFIGNISKYVTDLQALVTGLVPGARLTLTTGVPVTTADVTAATTLYYSAYGLGQIALYNGSRWITLTFSELSIAVPATTSQMYDVFVFDTNGTATLELLAWTNDTTRATALVRQNGILCKSGALTRRYVGSFRTTAVSGQTEDSLAKRLVWNYYNRVPRPMRVTEATDTWTYTTGTWRQANGSAANQIALVVGVAEVDVDVSIHAAATNSGAVTHCGVAVGKDSTTVAAAPWNLVGMPTGGATFGNPTARIVDAPAAGYHFYAWLEESNATGTTTWYGDNGGGAIGPQSGIVGKVNG